MIAAAWVLLVAAVGGTASVVVRHAREMRAERRQTQALRATVDAVSREVAAGALPLDAMARAAEHAPDVALATTLSTGCAAVRLGAPVAAPDGSREPIAHLFRLWSISQCHGVGLVGLTRCFVIDLDATLSHISKAQSAMAGARLTVVVLLALPCGAVALGESMGFHTARFLTTHGLGLLLLGTGTGLICAGTLWAEKLSVTVLGGVGGRAGPLAAARTLDIAAAGLHAGMPLVEAWGMGVGDSPTTALLRLGAADAAWSELSEDPHYGPVARQAAHHTRSGAALAEGMRDHAMRLRQLAADRATAGAERVLVALAAPLTLCFLPAFVLVGLIPLAIGLAGI